MPSTPLPIESRREMITVGTTSTRSHPHVYRKKPSPLGANARQSRELDSLSSLAVRWVRDSP